MEDKELKKIGTVMVHNGQEKELKSGYKNGEYTQEVDGIHFDGHRVLWSFEYKPYNYLKESELSGDEWRKGGEMVIYRDGVSVFREFCRTPERAFVVLQYTLPRLKDFPFEQLVVGRKIYNHDVPATVTRLCDNGEFICTTESGEDVPWAHNQEEKKEDPEHYYNEWGADDRVHVLSEHIYWHRK